MIEIQGKYNTAKIFTENIEETALKQIIELCNQKAFEGSKIRIMPDTHAGKGCVIGFTSDLGGRIIPNLVGVDVGCGMEVTELGNVEIDFAELDNFIRQNVPHGKKVHQKIEQDIDSRLRSGIEDIAKKTESVYERHLQSLGTLGGGNHFIEVNQDDEGHKYLVIHSGSRNLGLQVAKYHQQRAEKYCNDKIEEIRHMQNREIGLLKQQGKIVEISSVIDRFGAIVEEYRVPKDLTFLEGELGEEYLRDMFIAQEFALLNRQRMSQAIAEFIGLTYHNLPKFTSVHNYIDPQDKIIRKGATRAYKGEQLIIPINMRDGSIIAVGKGNVDWNQSAPHGAGRILSRSKAKEVLNLDDFHKSMEGVWTSSVSKDTIDEAPMAYKPMEEILNNIKESVEVIKIIKPLYNFKAKE